MKPVYTVDDLSSRDRLDAGAGQPARLAVIGMPVAHSASPQMHQAALDANSIDARYIRLEVVPGQLADTVKRLRELEFIGINITVPHKFEAMACCDAIAEASRALGAINTMRFDADATRGFNTDGPGFAAAIAHEFGSPLETLSVAIAGAAGGAGQAIATQCVLAGVPRLVLINRSKDKLAPLVEHLSAIPGNTEIIALPLDAEELAEHCRNADLLVNTSSLGLKADDPSILPASCFQSHHRVYDTIYQPPQTSTLRMAAEHGCRTGNGLSMLIHQGALSFQHWFPGTDPLNAMSKALA